MEIFKLFGSIFVNTDDAENSISKTDKKVSTFASSLGNGIKTAAKWGIGIATAFAVAAVAAGGALVSIAENTREYRTEMGKLDTAFTTAGLSSDQATSTYKSLQSVLGETDTAVEAANHLAKLCDTQEELNKWTEICTGVFATFGDSLPIEGLTEAANETAKVGQVTGPLADALNWAGVSEDAFNDSLAKCTTEQERQALITETLNGLYSEASEKYKETNKDVLEANAAQEKITSTMAKFGEIAEPVVTMAKQKFADFLESLLPIADIIANNVIPGIVSISEKAMPVLGEGIDFVSDKINALISFLRDHKEEIKASFETANDVITNKLIPGLENLYNKAIPVVTEIVDFVIKKVEEIADFIEEHREEIEATIQGIVDTATEIIEAGIDIIKSAIDKGKEAFEDISTAIQDMMKWCEQNKVALELLGVFIGTVTALVIAYNAATIAASVASGIETLAIYALIAADGAAAIAKGILTGATTIWTTVAGVATGVTTGLGAAIAFLTSPIALVILAIGAIIAIGVLLYNHWDEIKVKASELGDKISEIFENIKNAVSEKLEAVKSAVSEKFNAVKDTMGTVMQAAKDTIDEKLTNIKDAYESHGGGIKGVVAAFIEGVKGYYSAGYTFINNLTGGKLSEIANKFSEKLDIAKGYVSDKMGAIKDKFSSIIGQAADKIEAGIDKIKSFFKFEWSLPKLKLPHFNISGGFSLTPPSAPSFDVEWYKNGGVMTQPTAFGLNPLTGKVMGGGEAEPEAIAPISVLQGYVKEAVAGQNQELVSSIAIFEKIYEILVSYLPSLANLKVILDTGVLAGEIAPQIDAVLGDIASWKGRNG